jgi:large subunit ribosomal protein L9
MLKVILIKDMEKLGSFGDIVNVKDGYAKNMLLPTKSALIATEGNVKQVELIKKSKIKEEAKNVKEASGIAEVLKDVVLKFKVKASDEGKLYGSITNKDLAEKILEFKKVEVDRKKIHLDEPIKETGEHEVEVKLFKDIKSIIKVRVIPEKEPKPEESKEEAPVEEATGTADEAPEDSGSEQKEPK